MFDWKRERDWQREMDYRREYEAADVPDAPEPTPEQLAEMKRREVEEDNARRAAGLPELPF